jgi:hypothetical protein
MKLHPSAEEVLKEEGQIHEVIESRLFEFHKDIDIAGVFLLTSGK